MKLLLCTKNDLFGAVILNYLLPELNEHGLQHHDIRVLLSDKARSGEDTIPELRAEKFLEREYPLQHFFPTLDSDAAAGQWLTFNKLAAKFGISIEREYDINGTESTQRLTTRAPDLILSARFSLIFKPHILALARHGAYNVHPGVLPGYAGVLAPLRALWNAEWNERPRLGCTVHQIDKGIDTGPVYSISYLAATPGRAVQSYIPDLYRLGIDRLLELIKWIDRGHHPQLTPQDPAAFRYFGPPTAEDYRANNIPLYDLSDYAKLLQQFLPADAATESRLGTDRSNLESLLSQHLKQSAARPTSPSFALVSFHT